VENRVPMARSVNTGVSCFIDSTGRVEQLVTDAQGRSQDVDGFAVHTMRFDSRASIFGRVGVWPSVIMAIGTAALIIGGWWRSPAPQPGRKTTTTNPA
jgi:apolipoprotein N-acyltransferase